MKNLIITLFLLSTFNAFSAEYNGYIVKLKSNSKHNRISHYIHVKDRHHLKNIKNNQWSDSIEYIEPNYIYHKFLDKKFQYQWALENRGLNSGDWNKPGLEGEDIDASKAWEHTTGSKKLIIAVIDSGIDLTHPDLIDNLWISEKELKGRPGIDDDGNGIVDDIHGANFINNTGKVQDDDGHGTHCAGIIGAKHNKIGIRGVLNNVQLMPLKFLDGQGNGETINAIKAIHYAVDHGAKIISNSWGGDAYTKALYEAIEYAQSKGVIFVAAVGNSNNDNDKNPIYPSSYDLDNIVAVASSSPYARKALSSNYGVKSVDILAPGERILSTYKGHTYKRLSGTSMAAPYVAGTIGLMYSIAPQLNYQSLIDVLLQSTEQSIHYVLFTHSSGRLNSYNAIEMLL